MLCCKHLAVGLTLVENRFHYGFSLKELDSPLLFVVSTRPIPLEKFFCQSCWSRFIFPTLTSKHGIYGIHVKTLSNSYPIHRPGCCEKRWESPEQSWNSTKPSESLRFQGDSNNDWLGLTQACWVVKNASTQIKTTKMVMITSQYITHVIGSLAFSKYCSRSYTSFSFCWSWRSAWSPWFPWSLDVLDPPLIC